MCCNGVVSLIFILSDYIILYILYLTFSQDSIQMRILPPDHPEYVSVEDRGFETCQLLSRHWDIIDHQGQHSHVRGEGVVGLYPLLRETGHRVDTQVDYDTPITQGSTIGDWVSDCAGFRYQSLSGNSLPGGSFGGELIFLPGSIQSPSGDPFNVAVGRFSLDIPKIIML